jgi:putative membrane protein
MKNPWLRAFFEFHRADTFRKLLPTLAGLACLTALVAWLEMEYLCLAQAHPLKNITLMHSLLGFAISMLLVFRTNTAYDRWWEGRKLWGNMVNSCRGLAMKVATFTSPSDQESRDWFATRLASYPREVKAYLQTDPHATSHPLDSLCALLNKLHELCRQDKLPESRLFLLCQEVSGLGDTLAGCERIRNSPIPVSYFLFIKKFIVAYTLTLPLGFAFSLGWLAVPVVVFVFYVLASLEMIAEQIEEPFGNDAPDLPMGALCSQIEHDVQRILARSAAR